MLWDSYIFIIYWIGVGLPYPVVVVLLAHRLPALRFVPRSFYVLSEPDQAGTYLSRNQYIRIRIVNITAWYGDYIQLCLTFPLKNYKLKLK